MFKTLVGAFKNKDIRKKIIYTLLILVVVRVGSLLPIPGVDTNYFSSLLSGINTGDLSYLSAFTGGSFERMSLFALSITPYITSSIIMQLLTIAIPKLEEMQKEGEDGRKKIASITRYVTIGLSLIESIAMAVGFGRSGLIKNSAQLSTLHYVVCIIVVVAALTAGSAVLMWLGERITEKGVGNGISFIILVGIIARLPHSLFQEFVSRTSEKTGGLVMFLFEMLFLLLVIAGAILLVQGTRKVPVQYAKRIIGNKQYGGARQYIPLKVNAANVMPIIFAQAIMFIPISIVGFSSTGEQSGFWAAFMDNTGFWYNFVFAVLIILFTYFYTAITINPTQMSDDLKRNNGFIPGIKPGKQTAEYIDVIMSRITLPGSFFLALVAIMPAFAGIFGVKAEFAQFFGGTSLLILVGVVLDTLQQVESHLLMRHYDGLLKSGRIKGRSGNVAAY